MTPEDRAAQLVPTHVSGSDGDWVKAQVGVWVKLRDDITAAIRAAVAAERERCAQVVEEQSRLLTLMFEGDDYERHGVLCRDLAAAIRKGE